MKEKLLKKGLKKRLFSVVLALTMVVSLIPMNTIRVYAASYPSDDWNKIGYIDGTWKLGNSSNVYEPVLNVGDIVNGCEIGMVGEDGVVIYSDGEVDWTAAWMGIAIPNPIVKIDDSKLYFCSATDHESKKGSNDLCPTCDPDGEPTWVAGIISKVDEAASDLVTPVEGEVWSLSYYLELDYISSFAGYMDLIYDKNYENNGLVYTITGTFKPLPSVSFPAITTIELDSSGQVVSVNIDRNGNVASFNINTPTHTHGSWDYSASGATLTAECKATTGTCDLDDGTGAHKVSLTLSASSANYSGSPISATVDKTAWEAAGLTVPVIKYVGKGTTNYEESETAPTAVGKYTAKITVDNKTALVDFEIIDPNATPDDGNVKVPEDKQDGNFEAGGIKNSTEEVKSAVLTTEDKEAIEAGKDVLVWVEIKDHTETVTKEDKTKVEEKLEKAFTVGTYLDVSLWKQITGSDASKVTDVPNGKVKIGFTIPKDLQKANRTYKIVRVHDGVAEIIDAVVDAEFGLTFETDRFSTYALIYTDADVTKPAETPATGDTSPIALYVLLMGLAGVAMLVSKKRRIVR